MLFYVILLLSIFTKIILLLFFYLINLFFHENCFCFFMFWDVPGCSGMFRHVPGFIDAQSHISVHNVTRRLTNWAIWPRTSELTQVKSHISVHNVTRCLTSCTIWSDTSVLTQVKSHIGVHNERSRLTALVIWQGTSLLTLVNTQCNKAFNNSCYLTTHLRTHPGGWKPY